MEKNNVRIRSGICILCLLLLATSAWRGKKYISFFLQNACYKMTKDVFLSSFFRGQTMELTFLKSIRDTFNQEVVPEVSYETFFKGNEKNNLVENQWEESEDNLQIQEKSTPQTLERKWRNPNYLRKYVYQVDGTTMVTNGEINGARLMNMDLSIHKTSNPQILIYHTHGSEAYKDSRRGKKSDTVIGVGDVLTKKLKQYGYQVIHDRKIYDVKNGKEERSKAYTYAANSVESYLKRYPSIQVVIDIHRDGVKSSTHLVTKQNGISMAQIMFFNGASRTARHGDIKYLKNPNKMNNFAFSLQLQANGKKKYPGFLRKIYVKGYRYNLHYRGRSLLIEVGAQNNTVHQAKASMLPLSKMLDDIL